MGGRIDGTTQLAGLIGWPLDHTLSPAMHNAAYEALGLDWVYVPLAVRDGASLTKVVAGLRGLPFVGFNVTMPYKRLMLNLCDEVATQARARRRGQHRPSARRASSSATTPTAAGFSSRSQDEAGFTPEGRRAVVVGAGGAAGAARGRARLGASRASWSSPARRVEQAEDLVDRVGEHARETELLAVELGPAARGARGGRRSAGQRHAAGDAAG